MRLMNPARLITSKVSLVPLVPLSLAFLIVRSAKSGQVRHGESAVAGNNRANERLSPLSRGFIAADFVRQSRQHETIVFPPPRGCVTAYSSGRDFGDFSAALPDNLPERSSTVGGGGGGG